MNPSPTTSSFAGDALIANEQGAVVAIVTDISPSNANQAQSSNTNKSNPSPSQHLLSTDSQQTASILPPLIPESDAIVNADNENQENVNVNGNQDQICPPVPESRWNKDNRMILKQLMGSLPPYDIGAALRVILDTFGVESSKLVRRGEYIELDLKAINDDYILDSLWNYCAQMQFNIMSTLQQQQMQQHAQQQQVNSIYQPMQSMAYGQQQQQQNYQQHAVYQQVQLQQVQQPAGQMTDA